MENWDGWLTLLSVVETGTLSGAAAQLTIPDTEELAAFIGADKKQNARRQRLDGSAASKP